MDIKSSYLIKKLRLTEDDTSLWAGVALFFNRYLRGLAGHFWLNLGLSRQLKPS